MDSQRRALGRQIVASRRAKGWNAARLAQEAGISENTLSRIERGLTYQDGKLRAVLDALGIEPTAPALGTDYPPDIEQVRAWVGAHLAGQSPERRRETADALIRFLIERNSAERPNTGA